MTNDLFPKGSEWRKWDLHIHSPLSILNNQYTKLSKGRPDWESFINKLEMLDMPVIGITDYFTIEGYKIMKSSKEAGSLRNINTILPNIEFRLNRVISSKKDGNSPKRLNFHVIFSDELPINIIEEHFLHDITFAYEGDPQNKDQTRRLKVSNLEELGSKLKKEHESFRDGRSDLEIGAMNAVVDDEEISKILSEDNRFEGKYLIVFPEELLSLIDWDGQDHNTRKVILQKSNMIFSSNKSTREWCLGSAPYMEGEDKFIEEFKTLKPCIHGSDAHELDSIGYPCALRGDKSHNCSKDTDKCELRYAWIKADPTFEGLKQLLFEPKERVIIQKNNPIPMKSNFSISNTALSESIINDDLSIKNTDIPINYGLVAVTGGKGSGKTALVDLIANCYFDRCTTDDKNSFVRRILDHNPNIITTLLFKGGNEFTKHVNEATFTDDSQIVYIAQGELEKYIGDESDLDEYIKALVFESPQIKNSAISFEFSDLIEKVNELNNNILSKNKQIEQLEQITSDKVFQETEVEKNKYESELKDKEIRIKELEKSQNEEQIKLAKKTQQTLSESIIEKNDLSNLRNLLKEAISFLDGELLSFNRNIQQINILLKKLNIPDVFIELSYDQKHILNQRFDEVSDKISQVIQKIDTAQKDLKQHEYGIRDLANLFEGKRELNSALEYTRSNLEKIQKDKKQLVQELQERNNLYEELIKTLILQKKKYGQIISLFSSQKADVLSDLNFVAKMNFDSNRFIKTAEDLLDNRKVIIEKNGNEKSIFEVLFTLFVLITNGEEDKIPELIDKLQQLNEELKYKMKASKAITNLHLYNFLYDNYLEIIPVVKYKNTSLSKLSMGQKATVLIKIYLALGDKPIIIDSHDDHLDNEFIMDELVKALRQAKNYRQIILVSNNGNVVINSDAEQIIVACRENIQISYISGSIENPNIRDRALKVLEGGYDAFKKRQQKYRIKLQ